MNKRMMVCTHRLQAHQTRGQGYLQPRRRYQGPQDRSLRPHHRRPLPNLHPFRTQLPLLRALKTAS